MVVIIWGNYGNMTYTHIYGTENNVTNAIRFLSMADQFLGHSENNILSY